MENHRLLGGANNAIVKLAARHDLFSGFGEVDAPVQNYLDIAWAYAVGRFATAVRGFDHALATGCHHYIDGLHQCVGELGGRFGDDLNQMLRRTQCKDGFVNQFDGGCTGPFCPWMRGHDDGIAPFEREHGIAHWGGGGIGDRGDRTHDTHRFGYRDNPSLHVALNNADGTLGPQTLPNEL